MESIQYKPYQTFVDEEIITLYKSVGWSNYYENSEMLKLAYENSLYTLGAYNGNELIGIIRIVGDGHSIIYIQDIIVHSDFQRRKIGSTLIELILCQYKNVYQKILTTDDTEKTKEFYKNLGFTEVSNMGCITFQHYVK